MPIKYRTERIAALKPIKESDCRRFFAKVKKTDSCWEWIASKIGRGYGAFEFGGHCWGAHRFSFFMAKGYLPEGKHILHHCDFKPCVNPAHLFAGTHQENMTDAAQKHLMTKGEESHFAKLTQRQVEEIRSARGMNNRILSGQYGVCRRQISRIRNYAAWKHVTP